MVVGIGTIDDINNAAMEDILEPPAECHLLKLPAEIRNQIYAELLHTRKTKVFYDKPLSPGHAGYFFGVGILRTNRLIYHESVKILEENRFIKIKASWSTFQDELITATKFPLIARRREGDSMPKCYMAVDLLFTEHQRRSKRVYISCAEDLPEFCRNLFYHGMATEGFNQLLHITLDVQDPFAQGKGPAKCVQESLLLPFGILKNLKKLETGKNGIKPINAVEKHLRRELKRPNPSAKQYLEKATKLKDEGNEAYKAGEYARSIRLYFDAYAAMHIHVLGRRFQIVLDGKIAPGWRFSHVWES